MRPKAPHLRQGHPRGPQKPLEAPLPARLGSAPPPAPEHLGELGAAVWEALWDQGRDVYRPTDSFILDRYCSLQERRAELLAIIAREGWMTVGSQGQQVPHPAARLLESFEKEMVRLEDRLFLNPDARIRMGVFVEEKRSKLDAFLEG